MGKNKQKCGGTAIAFHDPVVQVTGEMCGFRAHVGVKRKDVEQRVMAYLGLSKHSYGYQKCGRLQVPRAIQLAFRNQRASYMKRPVDPRKVFCKQIVVKKRSRFLWSLTEEGVKRAKLLSEAYQALDKSTDDLGHVSTSTIEDFEEDRESDNLDLLFDDPNEDEEGVSGDEEGVSGDEEETPSLPSGWVHLLPVEDTDVENLTAAFFDRNWSTIRDVLCRELGRRWSRSRDTGRIEDHVMNFVAKKIKEDRFKRHLQDGKPLPMPFLLMCAHRSAISDFRGYGTDPVMRIQVGARTETELHQRAEDDTYGLDFEHNYAWGGHHAWRSDRDHWERRHEYAHFNSGLDDVEELVAGVDQFNAAMERIESLLERQPEKKREQRARLLKEMKRDSKMKEIAESLNVQRSTVSNQIHAMKKELRKSLDRGAFRGILD
jgi:DNA-directed RNA polymerase specialized sigma24 family protein